MGEEILLRYGLTHEREVIVNHVLETADRYWGDVLCLIQDLRETLKMHRRPNQELVADVGPRHPIMLNWFKNNGFDVRVHAESKRALFYFAPRPTIKI